MLKKSLIIESHYIGNIEYFVALQQFQNVTLEIYDYYIKQTYRNRCEILTATGIHSLSIPVHYKSRTIFKDVLIDYSQTWIKDHCGAIRAAYGKAPFYDFFASQFFEIILSKPKFLLDLNFEILTLCLKILQIDIQFDFSTEYKNKSNCNDEDFRGHINPKYGYESREIYKPNPYIQVFGNKFVPDLCLLDILMCEGTNAASILRRSKF